MKKHLLSALSLALALPLLVNAALPVFAASGNSESVADSGEVSIPIAAAAEKEDKLSVKIDWGNMLFTYQYGVWNPETLRWESDNAGWQESGNDIAVTN